MYGYHETSKVSFFHQEREKPLNGIVVLSDLDDMAVEGTLNVGLTQLLLSLDLPTDEFISLAPYYYRIGDWPGWLKYGVNGKTAAEMLGDFYTKVGIHPQFEVDKEVARQYQILYNLGACFVYHSSRGGKTPEISLTIHEETTKTVLHQGLPRGPVFTSGRMRAVTNNNSPSDQWKLQNADDLRIIFNKRVVVADDKFSVCVGAATNGHLVFMRAHAHNNPQLFTLPEGWKIQGEYLYVPGNVIVSNDMRTIARSIRNLCQNSCKHSEPRRIPLSLWN